jgi:hypothetical protein
MEGDGRGRREHENLFLPEEMKISQEPKDFREESGSIFGDI